METINNDVNQNNKRLDNQNLNLREIDISKKAFINPS